MNETEFCAEIKWETESSLLLTDGAEEFWIPKSLIFKQRHISKSDYEFVIPEWLAIQKGIV